MTENVWHLKKWQFLCLKKKIQHVSRLHLYEVYIYNFDVKVRECDKWWSQNSNMEKCFGQWLLNVIKRTEHSYDADFRKWDIFNFSNLLKLKFKS